MGTVYAQRFLLVLYEVIIYLFDVYKNDVEVILIYVFVFPAPARTYILFRFSFLFASLFHLMQKA